MRLMEKLSLHSDVPDAPTRGIVGWGVVAGILAVLVALGSAQAAETVDPTAMTKTLVLLKLDTPNPLAVRWAWQADPPTLAITFPSQQVVGNLPEYSAVANGVIEGITTRYEHRPKVELKRFIRSIQIVLSAAYACRVESEPGQVVIEIEHPASLGRSALEVGLQGGTVIQGFGQLDVSERFRAMQEALARAASSPTAEATRGLQDASSGFSQSGSGEIPAILSAAPSPQTNKVKRAVFPSPEGAVSGLRMVWPAIPVSRLARTGRVAPVPFGWIVLALSILATAGMGLWRMSRRSPGGSGHRAPVQPASAKLPPGLALIDQLVWKAFEAQGYALVSEAQVLQPLLGMLRVVKQAGAPLALVVVGNGLLEKQTVEQCADLMRRVHLERGLLVAPGAVTIPAQREAKIHQITLIGRDQLAELLGEGAGREFVTGELEQQRQRLEESQEALRRYASELELMRRQRNEASWYLGEERAKSVTLDTELERLTQDVRQRQLDIQRWEQDASLLRKQWEESQWYLGESQARERHVEAQLTDLQEVAKRAADAEQERGELVSRLEEGHVQRAQLESAMCALQEQLDASASRERALQDELHRLKRDMELLRLRNERRGAGRVSIPDAVIELSNGQDTPFFTGSPRDVSATGLGLETAQELPRSSVRIRLSLPGLAPIESKGRLIWQQSVQEGNGRYRSGCRLVRLPHSTRASIEQLLTRI